MFEVLVRTEVQRLHSRRGNGRTVVFMHYPVMLDHRGLFDLGVLVSILILSSCRRFWPAWH